MQRRPLIFLLLAFLTGPLLLGSCGLVGEKDAAEKPPPDTIHFQATLNGELWTGRPNGIISRIGDVDWLIVSGQYRSNESLYGEYMSLSVAFEGPGQYSLLRTRRYEGRPLFSGSYFVEEDGDVGIADYHPTGDPSANQLTITSYDSATGIIEGTFRTTLIVTEDDEESEVGEPSRRWPDRLRFTDGSFKVKVEDRRGE